jgi:hypothetical protein
MFTCKRNQICGNLMLLCGKHVYILPGLNNLMFATHMLLSCLRPSSAGITLASCRGVQLYRIVAQLAGIKS